MSFKLAEVKYNQGIIRSRINLYNASNTWFIELYESAVQID